MPDIPIVSVVIPLYNKELYIARAINSVLNQTIQDFEVIVIDDGSTDGGANIVREFSNPKIHLIQQVNQGVSAARNRGIEESQAELIAFLDADDEWLPKFIETILRLRSLYPSAGLFGTAYEMHVLSSVVQISYNSSEGERLLSSYFGALVSLRHLIINSSSFAAPKDVLKEVKGYPLGIKWSEDGTLWGKIALKYPVAYSPKICSIYHQYTENNSNQIMEYMENYFINYISTIPKDELFRYPELDDLMNYCDLCRIAAISRNIFSGHGARARAELQFLKSSHCKWIKYKMLILSYIPPQLINIVKNHEKNLSKLKGLIFPKFRLVQ